MSDSNEKARNSVFEERLAQAKMARKIVFFSVLGLVLILLIVIGSGYLYVKNALSPMDQENNIEIEVTIPIGSTTTQIGSILEDSGLIRNSTFFRYYVRYKNESGFQAGEYVLSPSMTMDEIIYELKDGRMLEDPALVFTIPEGLWLEQVVKLIAEHTDHEVDDIMETINDPDYLNQLIDQYTILTDDILDEEVRHPLEGYLFPARYDFIEEKPEIETIIEAMISRMENVLMKHSDMLEDSEYSVHEILTLASIIEREAQKSEDRYLISGVLYNRLEEDMMLQVDPTVAYALGEHRYMTSHADLEVDSPYNTYRYKGIPVGPIGNPGEDSIVAALDPEDTNYLFFYARYNGEVIYNETYEAHNETHQKYRHEWVEAQEEQEES
ncbi:endolytic transglycosylase MltG [Halalkalibacterium halodurans]|uniref:endolytic transglycosylase MltG n=1 Tax=Halalkalibacterium halodurans TaxID=86665 RepID=UPI002AAA3314|nr:endolytic transglycosylase MltG [Halalkalibacterium halodurans]MDY7221797.1 endolytic transglycosylase MltG [Halalkalibacterium halodurans]MDY7241073.1 endolytic transglycosylase MltG [Halalkalibacterium halodurans]